MPCISLNIKSRDTLAISSVTATEKGTGMPQQVEMNVNFSGSSPKKRYVKLTYGSDAETLDIPAGVLKVGVTRYFNPGTYTICATLI